METEEEELVNYHPPQEHSVTSWMSLCLFFSFEASECDSSLQYKAVRTVSGIRICLKHPPMARSVL